MTSLFPLIYSCFGLGLGLSLSFLRPQGGGGGGGLYEGPLDIVSDAVIAYSSRALSAARRGSQVYTIRRDSDDATQSFSSDATTGLISEAAINSFLAGANGFIAECVGQTGNSVTQSVPSKQPAWLANAVGGLPGLVFNGTSQLLTTAGNTLWTGSGFTCFLVFSIPNNSNNRYVVGVNAATGPDINVRIDHFSIDLSTDDATFSNGAGTNFLGVPDVDVYHIFDAAIDAPHVGAANLDGVILSPQGTPGYGDGTTGTINKLLAVGADDAVSPSLFFNGTLVEIIAYNSALMDADRLAIRQNIATAYGIVLS